MPFTNPRTFHGSAKKQEIALSPDTYTKIPQLTTNACQWTAHRGWLIIKNQALADQNQLPNRVHQLSIRKKLPVVP